MKQLAAGFLCSQLLSPLAVAQAPAPARTTPPAPQVQAPPLTLGEMVRRALEEGFALEQQREALGISLESLPIARSTFDPTLSASVNENVRRSRATDGDPASSSRGRSANVGVSQRLPTGTSLSVSTNLNRSSIDPAFAALNPAYASDATVNVTQPLLQGAGITVNTAQIRSAEITTQNARRSYFDFALGVIQQVENAYYALASARERLIVARTSASLAQRQLDETTRRHASGLLNRLDVQQTQFSEANARQAVLQAESAVKSAEDALLALVGRFEFDTALGEVKLEDPPLGAAPAVQDVYERALARSPALLNARDNLQLAELDVKLRANDLKPTLDLSLAVGINGDDGNGRGALSEAFNRQRSSWQAGLNVSVPWGRRAAKSGYRQAEAGLRQDKLALQQQEQDLLLRVREAVRTVETSQAGVALAGQSVAFAEQTYEAERRRQAEGLSTTRAVLDAQADLESARVDELQAKLNLQNALAELRRIEASGAERYGVTELIEAQAREVEPPR